MAQQPPQIFRDEDGHRILFGIRLGNGAEADRERDRVKELVESHGGRVVGYSAYPKTGYMLVDTETDEGRQLSTERHAPPQRYVVHYAWPELCINAGRILPPLLHPPVFVLDGEPVKIHLHKSLSHDSAEALRDLIQDYGGDTDIDPDEANVIIASQKHVSYRTLLKRYKGAVQTPPWVYRMIKRGKPLVAAPLPGPPEVPQPAALPRQLEEVEVNRGKEPEFEDLFPHQPPSRERVGFTPEEDLQFIKYLADLDVLIAGGLAGNSLYQHMRDTQPWAKRHTWQSWRQRYHRNKAIYIEHICKQARRNYAALPPPKKREVQERYKIRKEMDKAKARRRREQLELDEFGLHKILGLPGDASEEAEDVYDLWAQQMPDDEPVRPQNARRQRAVDEDEVHGQEEEEEEEAAALEEEPPVQDNDADFLQGYVGEMNTIDYGQAVAANDVEEDAIVPVRPPSPAAPPVQPRRATRVGSKAPQLMPPPAAKPASRAVPAPPVAGLLHAPAQPVAGPSRLPASRRDSMAEVENALVPDSESDAPRRNGKRRGKRGHVSSDDEDAQLLLQHHEILKSVNQQPPQLAPPSPQPPKPTKKLRAAAPDQTVTVSPRKLRARPGSVAPPAKRRATSVRVAPAPVPIVRAGSSTSEADGAFRPPRNTRARAVRDAQTPFTPLPNTRAAQVTNSRGDAV